MIVYELAAVQDRGSYWNVNGVTKNTFETIDREEKYLKLSYSAYKIIGEAINNGNQVRILKPLQCDEVLPGEIKILKTDANDIDSIREASVKRVRMLITPDLASVAGLTFYRFTCLNNDLADKGFFITDDNREEKYLAMLETGDQGLIDKLEEYLNYKDEIERVSSLNDKFNSFMEEIRDLSVEKEITELADKFLEEYYARF